MTYSADGGTTMMNSAFTSAVNSGLQSQNSFRNQNKAPIISQAFQTYQEKVEKKEEELRLSMLGIEISDPNQATQKESVASSIT